MRLHRASHCRIWSKQTTKETKRITPITVLVCSCHRAGAHVLRWESTKLQILVGDRILLTFLTVSSLANVGIRAICRVVTYATKMLWLIKVTKNVVKRFTKPLIHLGVSICTDIFPSFADQVHFRLTSTWTIIRFNINEIPNERVK